MSMLRFPLEIQNRNYRIPFRARLWLACEWVAEFLTLLVFLGGMVAIVWLTYLFFQVVAMIPGD